MNRSKKRNPLIFEELEPRLLLSADLAGIAVDLTPSDTDHQPDESDLQAIEQALQSEQALVEATESEVTSQELVIIDPTTPDYQSLVDDLISQNGNGRSFEIVLLDSAGNGIEQIDDILNAYQDLDAVHILSHGSDGGIQLGDAYLNLDSLSANASTIESWHDAFSEEGDLLIYGCDLAASEDGQSLVEALARLTGADVAASDDLTGHEDLGGDWDLEHAEGVIETEVVVSEAGQRNWSSVLATDIDFINPPIGVGTGLSAGTVVATDPVGGTIAYSLVDDAGGMFSIDSGSGELFWSGVPDTSTMQSYDITVRVTDSGAPAYDEVMTITTGTGGSDSITGTSHDDLIYGLGESGSSLGTTNYVTNGSFESGGSPDTTGWSVIVGTLLQTKVSGTDGVVSTDGSYYLDSEAPDGNNTFEQTISGLTNGNDYQISFDAADAMAGGSNSLQIYFGGVLLDTLDPNTTTMQSFSYNVTADSGDGTNELRFVEAGGIDGPGTAIDNVRMYEVLPSSGGDTLDGGAGDDILIGDDVGGNGSTSQSLTINDAGFEDIALPDGGTTSLSAAWTDDFNNNEVFIGDPSTFDFSSGAPAEGENALLIPEDNQVSQTLASNFNSGNDYELSLQIGNPISSGNGGAYSIQLYAGGTLIGSATGTEPASDTWVDVAILVDGEAYAAADGSALRIVLSNTSPFTGSLDYFAVDDIQLNEITATEAGDDTLTGGAGDDYIDGGAGTDTAVFSGNRTDYTINYYAAADELVVTDTRGGSPDGTDTLINVEILQFSDQAVTITDPSAQFNDAPVGLPTITGTATEDQTLTADTSGISDADGLGTFSFQWLRDSVAITGATDSTYTLGDGDVGTQISIEVSYTDGQGTNEGPLTSAQTAAVLNINDIPLLDSASLSVTEGQTVTLSDANFGITDPDDSSFTYTVSSVTGGYFQLSTNAGVSITTFTSTQLSANEVQFVDDGNEMAPDFDVTVNDGEADSNTLATSITYTAANDAVTDLHYTQYIGGGEFLVNTITSSSQDNAEIVTLSDGSFVVVWESYDSGAVGDNIRFQRYDSDGNALGVETLVNTTETDAQKEPQLSALNDGGFVIVWQSDNQDSSNNGIFGRIFNADGSARTGEFQINTFTTDDQADPHVATLSGGDFVVVWESSNQDGSGKGVYSQRYDASGNALGTETQVHTATTNNQSDPKVSALSDGGYIVVWESEASGSYEVKAQQFDAAGGTVGAEFQINTTTSSSQDNSAVALLTDGSYVVVWESSGDQDGDSTGIFGQLLDNTGTAVGSEFQINSTFAGAQLIPVVIANDDGGFFVAWQSPYEDGGTDYATYVQQFDASANKINGEILINEAAPEGGSSNPALTLLNDGRLATVYQSYHLDGVYYDVFGRIFTPTLNENTANGTVVAIASQIVDPDSGDTHTFTLLDDAGGAFGINTSTGAITVADTGLIDFEIASTMNVTVRVTDGGGLTHDEVVTIAIQDVNETPTDLVASDSLQLNMDGNENDYASATNITDFPSTAMTYEISFASTTAGLNETTLASYAVSGEDNEFELYTESGFLWVYIGGVTTGNTISNDGLFDGEQHTLSVSWESTTGELKIYIDGELEYTESSFRDGVTLESGGTFILGQEQDSLGGGFQAYQRFEGDIYDVRIYNDVRTDQEIADNANSLLADPSADPNLVSNWQMTDNGAGGIADLAGSHDLSLFTDATFGPIAVSEDAANGTHVGYLSTIDPDAGDTHTYSLVDNAGGAFAIDINTGQVTVANTSLIDYETATTMDITVRTTDAGGLTYDEVITITIKDANEAPVGLPTITGTVTEDQILTADTSSISDDDGLGTFSYQWLRDGVAISGETASTYTLGDADVGTQISVEVSYTDGNGTSEGPLTSLETTAVTNVNDAPNDLHYTQYLGDAEFIVNTHTTDVQNTPDVVTLANGDFVVVWESANQDGDLDGVYFQRYDANGVAQGVETLVNTTTTDDQDDPQITALSNGGFAIVWEALNQDGDGGGIYGRIFDASGLAVTNEFLINTTTANDQYDPHIAALDGGGFVVVWESNLQDGDAKGIYSQHYDNTGVAQGGETQVHTTTTGGQNDPRVSRLNDGGYIVVWDSNATGSTELMAQRFDASGVANGTEFQVNTTTSNTQDNGDIAALSGGGFVIVWESWNQDGDKNGIYGQRFDAAGNPSGSEFLVNTFTSNDQTSNEVIALEDGSFIVAWYSFDQDGDSYGVYAQQFDASGNKVNGEFQINTTTANSQAYPTLTLLQDGRLVVVYESDQQDGSGDTVVGRIFTPTLDENSANGTVVAVASQIVDPDSGDTHTFTLLDDAGGAFGINTSTGAITVADTGLIDYETASSVNVTVRVTDSGGLTHDEVVTIAIINVDEYTPVANADNISVAEGGTATSLVSGATDVLSNDTGLGDTPVTISLVTGPTQSAAFTLNTDGTFSYTHNGSENFTDSFTYRVTDNDGQTSDATVTINITPVSDATPVAVVDSINVAEGGTATTLVGGATDVLSNDTGLGDTPVTVSLVTGPTQSATFTLNGDGTFSYTHNGSENFTDSFTYRITDNDGQTSDATVTINITPVSDQTPVAVVDTITVAEGATITTLVGGSNTVLNNDTGLGDTPVTVSLVTGPTESAAFTLNTDGTFSYTHNGSENFTDSFTYRVTDNDGQTSDATVTINVTPVSDQTPVAVVDTITVAEGATITTLVGGSNTVLNNDTGLGDAPVTVSLVTGPTQSSAFTLNADGTFSYTHNGSENFTDSFVYRVTDNDGQTSDATVTINITPVSDATPVAVVDSINVAEGGTATTLVGGATDVLNNDTGLGDTPVTVSLVTGPTQSAAFTLNADGTFSYTHNGSENFTDSFTYRITDNDGQTSDAMVTINVTPVSDATPVAVVDSITVAEGGTATTLVGGATDVLSNDTGLGDTPVTVSLVTGPTQSAAFTLNTDGTFSYTHNGSENFTDSFTYRVTDNDGQTSDATVTINVTPVSDATPVAVVDSITVAEGGTATTLVGGATDVLSNDTGLGDTPVTVSLVTGPTQSAAFTLNTDGTFSYTHNGTENFTDSFTYRVTDNDGQTSDATVTINITPVSDATPVAVVDSINVAEGGTATTLVGGATDVLSNDTGLGDTPVTVSLVTGPTQSAAFTLNTDGTFSYTHNGSENFTDSFIYRVTDNDGQTSDATVTINVTPVSDATPVAVVDSINVAEGGTATTLVGGATDVLNNDTGLGDTPVTVSLVTGPTQSAAFTLNADGTFSYTHNGSENFTDSFIYRVTDNDGQTSDATVTINITPVSDATPVAVADTITVAEGGTATTLVGGATDVLSNDTGLGDTPVTVSLVTGPTQSATFTLNGDGTFSYTHNGSENFTDSFTYRITDNDGQTSDATVTINITPVSDQTPVAVVDTITVAEGATITTLVGGSNTVLNNDTGLGDTPVTVSLVTGPTQSAAFTLNTDGTFSYTHNGSENFTDSFVYRVTDNDGQTSDATVTINVTSVSDTTPVANADAISVAEGGTATTLVGGSGTVLNNDTGLGETPVTVSLVTDVSQGSLTLNSDGTFSYTHDGSENLTDSFTYRVTDNGGETADATVTINVVLSNNSPIASEAAITLFEDTVYTGNLPSAVDHDGDTVIYLLEDNPLHGSITIETNGVFSYTPDADYHGADRFRYSVNDGNGGTNSYQVAISVISVNDQPVITSHDGSEHVLLAIEENSSYVTTVSAEDYDHDPVSFSIDGGSDLGLFSIDSVSGELTFDPVPDAENPLDSDQDNLYQVQIQVSDGNGGIEHQMFTIEVRDVDEFDVGLLVDIEDAPDMIFSSSSPNEGVGITAWAEDLDNSNSLITYSLDDNANGQFVIDPSTGIVSLASSIGNQDVSQFEISVRATSEDGSYSLHTFHIELNSVIDTPPESEPGPPLLDEIIFDLTPDPVKPVDSETDGLESAEQPNSMDTAGDEGELSDESEDGLQTPENEASAQSISNKNERLSFTQLTGDDRKFSTLDSSQVSLMPVPLSPETLPLFDTQSGDDIEVPESLWHLLDAMGREMSEHSDQQSSIDDRLEQVATISTVTLSAGYVAWLLRAGVLSASLLSSMPLWRQIDPLPVLSARAKRRNNNDNNLPEDDKRLENLFEKNNKDRTVPVRGK